MTADEIAGEFTAFATRYPELNDTLDFVSDEQPEYLHDLELLAGVER
jgi:hypothetical protein